uniref:Syndetin C-terminal domain-containing protein n=1 Tax=Takifugu rubripes TaxID=31033 RepID=A0A674NGW0_TAKRU
IGKTILKQRWWPEALPVTHNNAVLHSFHQQTKRSHHSRRPGDSSPFTLCPAATLTWKKCSNEGRALMQLDFQQFLMKLEKLTDLRPIPDKEFVETYIKAYYLTENDMEQFIKKLQLANLVNVCLGSHINKKARQKLLAAIDDIDRPKR